MTDPGDVLFVVLDSARRDRLSTYGHDRATTPTLDALAREGTVYEHAYTPAPWTLPSHASMFTSRLPSEHGVTNGFADQSLTVPEDVPTIAERLSDRGYRTAGFSNNPWVGQLSGLDRGFDEYVEWDLEISRRTAAAVHGRVGALLSRLHAGLGYAARQPVALLKRRFFTARLVARAQRWLGADDGPTFTFMNLMEAHSPYYPPASAFRSLGLRRPGPVEPRALNLELLAHTAGRRDLSASRRRRALDYYDASLRYQDRELAGVVATLKAEGRWDDALVVVCADHGKTVGEFDRSATPSHYVRNVNAKVPLVVKWPGQVDGERVERPVELTDLYGVLTGDLDRDSFGAAEGVALTQDSIPHTGRSSVPTTRYDVVADGRRKLARTDDGREFFFVGAGADERHVAAADLDEATVESLRDALSARLAAVEEASAIADTESSDAGLDRNVQGQLEDLGYL